MHASQDKDSGVAAASDWTPPSFSGLNNSDNIITSPHQDDKKSDNGAITPDIVCPSIAQAGQVCDTPGGMETPRGYMPVSDAVLLANNQRWQSYTPSRAAPCEAENSGRESSLFETSRERWGESVATWQSGDPARATQGWPSPGNQSVPFASAEAVLPQPTGTFVERAQGAGLQSHAQGSHPLANLGWLNGAPVCGAALPVLHGTGAALAFSPAMSSGSPISYPVSTPVAAPTAGSIAATSATLSTLVSPYSAIVSAVEPGRSSRDGHVRGKALAPVGSEQSWAYDGVPDDGYGYKNTTTANVGYTPCPPVRRRSSKSGRHRCSSTRRSSGKVATIANPTPADIRPPATQALVEREHAHSPSISHDTSIVGAGGVVRSTTGCAIPSVKDACDTHRSSQPPAFLGVEGFASPQRQGSPGALDVDFPQRVNVPPAQAAGQLSRRVASSEGSIESVSFCQTSSPDDAQPRTTSALPPNDPSADESEDDDGEDDGGEEDEDEDAEDEDPDDPQVEEKSGGRCQEGYDAGHFGDPAQIYEGGGPNGVRSAALREPSESKNNNVKYPHLSTQLVGPIGKQNDSGDDSDVLVGLKIVGNPNSVLRANQEEVPGACPLAAESQGDMPMPNFRSCEVEHRAQHTLLHHRLQTEQIQEHDNAEMAIGSSNDYCAPEVPEGRVRDQVRGSQDAHGGGHELSVETDRIFKIGEKAIVPEGELDNETTLIGELRATIVLALDGESVHEQMKTHVTHPANCFESRPVATADPTELPNSTSETGQSSAATHRPSESTQSPLSTPPEHGVPIILCKSEQKITGNNVQTKGEQVVPSSAEFDTTWCLSPNTAINSESWLSPAASERPLQASPKSPGSCESTPWWASPGTSVAPDSPHRQWSPKHVGDTGALGYGPTSATTPALAKSFLTPEEYRPPPHGLWIEQGKSG